jgi:DNA repair exonuclease SbcCD ATPase subunit
MSKLSSKKRGKTSKQRTPRKPQTAVARVANEQHLLPPPSDIIWRIVQLEQKMARAESELAKLQASSLGELSNLIEQMRTDCEMMQQNELVQMKAIQRARQAAIDNAERRAAEVLGHITGGFVSWGYFHSWVSRINEQIAQLAAEPEPAHE